jgi:hypothetical protein
MNRKVTLLFCAFSLLFFIGERAVGQGLPSPSEYAIFGAEEVQLLGFSYTDSYDSREGIYDDILISQNGNVGSNGNIYLIPFEGEVLVHGDVIPGPGYQVLLFEWAHVTGSTTPASQAVTVDSIQEFTPGTNDLVVQGNVTVSLEESIYTYNKVSVIEEGILVLSGVVRINCAEFEVLNFGKVVINGDVEVYCSTKFEVSEEAVFNAEGDSSTITTNTKVFVKGSTVELSKRGRFYGFLFAPQALVSISEGAQIFGSVVGREVKVMDSGAVHYDKALSQ